MNWIELRNDKLLNRSFNYLCKNKYKRSGGPNYSGVFINYSTAYLLTIVPYIIYTIIISDLAIIGTKRQWVEIDIFNILLTKFYWLCKI